jgi:hypothetical protein
MKRIPRELLSLGGLIGCCTAAVQVNQLIQGQAMPDLMNYAITAATAATGLGLTGCGWWPSRTSTTHPPDDRELTAAVDRLFAHFPDDETARESVRVVARAVTERRYRTVVEGK